MQQGDKQTKRGGLGAQKAPDNESLKLKKKQIMLKSFVSGTKKLFALGMNQNQIQKKKFWRKNMNSVGKFLNLQQPYQGRRAKSPQCKTAQAVGHQHSVI